MGCISCESVEDMASLDMVTVDGEVNMLSFNNPGLTGLVGMDSLVLDGVLRTLLRATFCLWNISLRFFWLSFREWYNLKPKNWNGDYNV